MDGAEPRETSSLPSVGSPPGGHDPQLLYQAQWLNREIDRKPYHGYDKNDDKKSQTESFDKLDPDYIREKKNVEEKMQMDEQFEERVH